MMNRFMERIATWWRSDRVRISPTAGRLLALQAGDRLIFDSQSFEVTNREVNEFETSYVLVLQLDAPGEHISIQACRIGHEMAVTATITRQGIAIPIFDEDVAILSGTR